MGGWPDTHGSFSVPQDSLILCRVAAKKYLELTAEERKTSLYPNVQEIVQTMFHSILTKTLQFQVRRRAGERAPMNMWLFCHLLHAY